MPYHIKTDYSSAVRKKLVQSEVYRDIRKMGYNRVIGLAGPNITTYLQTMKERGIHSAEVYEFNRGQLLLQMKGFNPVIPTRVCFDDILEADAQQKKTLYDLDFCCSIRKAKEHIKKFGKSAIITLALRPDSLMTTLKQFCKLIDKSAHPVIELDQAKMKDKGYKLHKLKINRSKYECYQYFDTFPMVTIKPVY